MPVTTASVYCSAASGACPGLYSLPKHDLYEAALQVLFVCESIKFGDRNMDKAGGLTFVSALSREEVATDGAREVFLVSASQLGVCPPTPHACALSKRCLLFVCLHGACSA